MTTDKEDTLATKEDVLILKTDLANAKAEIIRWIVAVAVAEVVLIVSLIKFL